MGGLISQDAGWFKLMTSYGEPAGLEQALHSPVLFDSILTTNTITGEEWDTMTNADIVGFALCTIGRLEQSRFELRAGNSTSFDTVALLERFSKWRVCASAVQLSNRAYRRRQRSPASQQTD